MKDIPLCSVLVSGLFVTISMDHLQTEMIFSIVIPEYFPYVSPFFHELKMLGFQFPIHPKPSQAIPSPKAQILQVLVQVTRAIRSFDYLDVGEDSRFCTMIPCANERTPGPPLGRWFWRKGIGRLWKSRPGVINHYRVGVLQSIMLRKTQQDFNQGKNCIEQDAGSVRGWF